MKLPIVTGAWDEECTAGRACADRLLRNMAEAEFPPALGLTMRAHLGRDLTGVEVGFFQMIAEAATR